MEPVKIRVLRNMSTYKENFERMIASKDRKLAGELMLEAKRRSLWEDYLISFLVSRFPIAVESLSKALEFVLTDSGASLLELAGAYQTLLEKYSNILFFNEEGITIIHPLESLPEETLKEFVRGFCDGRIFTSAQVSGDSQVLGMVFMPLLFGALNDLEYSSIGVVYEYLDKAGPRSINGYPIFFSMRMMNVSDWAKCREVIDREMERREEMEF